VAGKYRTGKSFLLNRIILNKKDVDGFGVGPTINPCTKVWNFTENFYKSVLINIISSIGVMDME